MATSLRYTVPKATIQAEDLARVCTHLAMGEYWDQMDDQHALSNVKLNEIAERIKREDAIT